MVRRGPYAINSARSAETAQALRQMAEMAERGEIIGLAYVVLKPNRRASVGAVGAATSDVHIVTHWLKKLLLILLKN